MNATVEVVRIDGHGTAHLSLHAKRSQAIREVERVGRLVLLRRFDAEVPAAFDAYAVLGRLRDEGWTVTVETVEVEL